MSAGSRRVLEAQAGSRTALGLVRWLLGMLVVLLLCLGTSAHASQAEETGRAHASKPLVAEIVQHPGDAPASPEIEQLDLPQPEGYNVHDSGWIHFSYHPSVLEFVQPLLKEAGPFKAELVERLGANVLEHVDVRIARTPREMRSLAPVAASVPSYASGVAYSQLGLVLLTIQPLHPNSQHDLVEIFKHELVHVALHDAVNGQPIPRWFNEGFAVQLSGENRGTRLWTLWSATLSEDLIPFSRLEASFPADPNSASVAYAEAADFTRYLMRSGDEHRFKAALERVRQGQGFLEALGDAYGTDVASLEYEWLEDVARRYTFWPVLFSTSVIWMLVLGLLILGWHRRKARAEVTLARWAREEADEDAKKKSELTEQGPPRVHIVLTRPSEAEVVELNPPRLRETDVPKVEHDGRWHTLH